MPHGAHDVGLLPVFVDGVTPGLAIDSQALVLLAKGGIPLLQRTVEQHRIDADQYISAPGSGPVRAGSQSVYG